MLLKSGITKKEFLSLALATLCSCIYSAAVFFVPVVSSRLIDEVSSSVPFETLTKTIVLFIASCLVQPLANVCRDFLVVRSSEGICLTLRQRLIQTFFQAPKDGPADSFTTVINSDVYTYCSYIVYILMVFTRDIFLLLLLMFGMFYISWHISCILLICFLLYSAINHLLSKRFEELSLVQSKNMDALYTSAAHANKARLMLYTYRNLIHIDKLFTPIFGTIKHTNIHYQTRSSLLESLSSAIMIFAIAFIYAYGSYLSYLGELSIGDVIALGLFFQLLGSPIQSLFSFEAQRRQAKVSRGRIAAFLSLKSTCSHVHIATQTAIELRSCKASFTTGDGKSAIFDVERFTGSGCLLIVGPSGSGKTTLLELIAGISSASEGCISVESTDAKLPLVYEQQVPCFVLGLTLAENLLGTSYTKDELNHCSNLLASLGMSAFIDELETVIVGSITYSGGEQKRLSLVRALCSKAPIVILDEITQGLDDSSVQKLIALIDEVKQDRLVIIATHDQRLDSLADSRVNVDGCIRGER